MAEFDPAGTVVKIGSTAIGNVKNFRVSPGTRSDRDRTNITHTGYRRVATGMRSQGACTFQMIADPADAGQILLNAAFEANTEVTFTIDYPGSTPTQVFVGRVAKHDFAADIDADMMIDVQLNVVSWTTTWPVE